MLSMIVCERGDTFDDANLKATIRQLKLIPSKSDQRKQPSARASIDAEMRDDIKLFNG
jgi:hypothetical protein